VQAQARQQRQHHGWQRLSYAEWKERNHGKKDPARGTMQMLVQKASVRLPRFEGGLFSSELRLQVAPVFMSRNDASTLYESMESSIPCLAWDQIVALTRTCKVVVVSLGADLDGANGRLKHKYAYGERAQHVCLAGRPSGGFDSDRR